MDKLLQILQDLHPDVDFLSEDGLIDGGILDSFDIVSIVAEIDAEFDIQIPPQALIPEHFNSARAIYALLRQLQDD